MLLVLLSDVSTLYIGTYWCSHVILYVSTLWCQHVTKTGAAAEPERDAEMCQCVRSQMKQWLHFPAKINCFWRWVVGVELQSYTENKLLHSTKQFVLQVVFWVFIFLLTFICNLISFTMKVQCRHSHAGSYARHCNGIPGSESAAARTESEKCCVES